MSRLAVLFPAYAETPANRFGYHEFQVGANHADRDPTSSSGNYILIRGVLLFFKFDPKKSKPITNTGAHRGCVLSDTTGEHQRIHSTQRRRAGADALLCLVAEQGDCFSRPNVLSLMLKQVTYDLYPCLRVMQIDTEVGPRNGLHPASRDQNRSILEPGSTFHIEVAEVPAVLIHEKALKDSKVTIRRPHVVTQHMRGAAQMGILGGMYRVLRSSWYGGQEELAVHPTCQRAPVFTHGNFLLT